VGEVVGEVVRRVHKPLVVEKGIPRRDAPVCETTSIQHSRAVEDDDDPSQSRLAETETAERSADALNAGIRADPRTSIAFQMLEAVCNVAGQGKWDALADNSLHSVSDARVERVVILDPVLEVVAADEECLDVVDRTRAHTRRFGDPLMPAIHASVLLSPPGCYPDWRVPSKSERPGVGR